MYYEKRGVANVMLTLYLTKYVDGFTYDDWNYYKLPFYDRPDGTIVNRKRINESFLKEKLMIPTYIKELINQIIPKQYKKLLQWVLK